MALDPESFRGMSPLQMLTALAVDEAVARGVKARSVGAACVACVDTGMTQIGSFCSCQKGSTLALQAFSNE